MQPGKEMLHLQGERVKLSNTKRADNMVPPKLSTLVNTIIKTYARARMRQTRCILLQSEHHTKWHLFQKEMVK